MAYKSNIYANSLGTYYYLDQSGNTGTCLYRYLNINAYIRGPFKTKQNLVSGMKGTKTTELVRSINAQCTLCVNRTGGRTGQQTLIYAFCESVEP